MVEMIDGPMIRRLIENQEEFNKYAKERLEMKNHKNEEKPMSNSIDHEEKTQSLEKYKEELRDMMMAIAKGIGNTPVNVMVEEGSFLLKVYEFEILRIQMEEKEKDEKRKKKKKIENNGCLNDCGNNDNVKIVVPRNKTLKKKTSFNLLNFCACSGKQFVENT